MKKRLLFIFCIIALLAVSVIGRAVHIQLVGDPRLARLARSQFHSKVLVSPRRGVIVDRNGEALAVNVETRSLAADPSRIKDPESTARRLAEATGTSYRRLLKRFDPSREFVWVERHLSEAQLKKLRQWELMDADGNLADGLWLVKESRRVYPHAETASHVLGFVNIDSRGLEGTELWFDERLKGEVVSVKAVKDALGRPSFMDAVAAGAIRDGSPVQLTIDASLQFSVEKKLAEAMEKTKARSGTVIVMDAVSGEIYAMANAPSFNPNRKAAPASHRRNRALTDGFEPGSTMKPILVASALENGWKLGDTVWGGKGEIVIQGKRISEAEADEKFEWLNLKDMVRVSSNVATATLAMKLGSEKYVSTLRKFGFGSKSGIGFPGEISGWLPDPKKVQPLTLANMGFGQGIMVTPIQMARAYAAVLNGGWLVTPKLIKTPESSEQSASRAPKRIFSKRVADGVTESLLAVTSGADGTGKSAVLDGYRVAGKTGTAQVVDPETRRYSKSRYIASFVGFAVDVEPKLVIFTSLDGPKGIYYAASTAAPLFRDVLEVAVRRFSIPMTDEAVLARKDAERRKLAEQESRRGMSERIKDALARAPGKAPGRDELGWSAAAPADANAARLNRDWTMPSLEGLSPREALEKLEGLPVDVQMDGFGLVRSQSPAAGARILDAKVIRLRLAEPGQK